MYELAARVRYSETDQKGQLRLNHLLDYFQDAATFHSMDLGIDSQGNLASGHVWYILCWDVMIRRLPVLGENTRVITDPYKMKGFYGYRRFSLYDEEDRLLVSADSIWVFMDLEKKIPVRIPDRITQLFVDPGTDDSVRIRRKLPAAGSWEEAATIEVSDFYLDSNHHVNNAYYVMWACSFLPKGTAVTRLRTDYRQSSGRGDKLHIYKDMVSPAPEGEGDAIMRIKYVNQDDTLISMVDLVLENEDKNND